MGLSLEDDGAAGTRPGNDNSFLSGLARGPRREAAYGHSAAWCGLGRALLPPPLPPGPARLLVSSEALPAP